MLSPVLLPHEVLPGSLTEPVTSQHLYSISSSNLQAARAERASQISSSGPVAIGMAVPSADDFDVIPGLDGPLEPGPAVDPARVHLILLKLECWEALQAYKTSVETAHQQAGNVCLTQLRYIQALREVQRRGGTW